MLRVKQGVGGRERGLEFGVGFSRSDLSPFLRSANLGVLYSGEREQVQAALCPLRPPVIGSLRPPARASSSHSTGHFSLGNNNDYSSEDDRFYYKKRKRKP